MEAPFANCMVTCMTKVLGGRQGRPQSLLYKIESAPMRAGLNEMRLSK